MLLPLLWILFYDPLLTAVKTHSQGYVLNGWEQGQVGTDRPHVESVAFADDTTWLAQSHSALQATLDMADRFLTAHDLESHPSKFTLLARGPATNPPPVFFGKDEHQNGGRGVIKVAPPDTSIRILGVNFSLGKPTGLNDVKAVNLVRDTTTTLSQKGVTAKQVLYVANRVSHPAVLFLG